MEPAGALLAFGTLLLSIAALLGFVQEQHRHSPELFAQWRVVHAGGSAGGVQLVALSAVWQRFDQSGWWTAALPWALVIAAWAFFIGPLARATGHARLAQVINSLGPPDGPSVVRLKPDTTYVKKADLKVGPYIANREFTNRKSQIANHKSQMVTRVSR
ncbi:MAG: hypothetical protein FJW14_07490 [Acidimicrobiia bacterium]|nr:hypothetical protein [Acidimicrobiia bacterium]